MAGNTKTKKEKKITTQETKEITVDGLLVRVERQRKRAERWTSKYQDLLDQNSELEKLACDYVETIEKMKNDFEKQIEVLNDLHKEKIKTVKKDVNMLEKLLTVSKDECFDLNWKLKTKQEVIAIGERELEKRRKQRATNKYKKFMTGPLYDEEGNLVTWLRRAVKRDFGVSSNVPVYVVKGNTIKRLGESSYWTTMSGHTVINYPNAYKWSKVYHKSTERIEVGKGWIARNVGRLAKETAGL